MADVVDDVEKEEEVDAVVVVVVIVVLLLLLLLLRMKPSLSYLTTLFEEEEEEEEEEEVVVVVVQVGVGAVRSIAFVSFSLFVEEIQKKRGRGVFAKKGEQKKKRTINQKKAKI